MSLKASDKADLFKAAFQGDVAALRTKLDSISGAAQKKMIDIHSDDRQSSLFHEEDHPG